DYASCFHRASGDELLVECGDRSPLYLELLPTLVISAKEGQIRLRVNVNEQDFFMVMLRERAANVVGAGGLAHAAFVIDDRDDFGFRHNQVSCEPLSCAC